ncbi:hypothetical protein [Spirochaeta thermophila]|uniref:hypothetical protein n=1 Tax=Winmispira thermophila TaxID=154 RepID=UPI0012DD9B34|nr:hypothetical protein [Spirochaeta thermophila]
MRGDPQQQGELGKIFLDVGESDGKIEELLRVESRRWSHENEKCCRTLSRWSVEIELELIKRASPTVSFYVDGHHEKSRSFH